MKRRKQSQGKLFYEINKFYENFSYKFLENNFKVVWNISLNKQVFII